MFGTWAEEVPPSMHGPFLNPACRTRVADVNLDTELVALPLKYVRQDVLKFSLVRSIIVRSSPRISSARSSSIKEWSGPRPSKLSGISQLCPSASRSLLRSTRPSTTGTTATPDPRSRPFRRCWDARSLQLQYPPYLPDGPSCRTAKISHPHQNLYNLIYIFLHPHLSN